MNRLGKGGTLARPLGLIVAAVIGILGVLGVTSPGALVRVVSFFQVPPILYIAAILRLVLGASLAWSASVSRFPRLLMILGVIIAIGGVATPFLGTRIARPILESWVSGGPTLVRIWGIAALALGAFVAYSFGIRNVPAGTR